MLSPLADFGLLPTASVTVVRPSDTASADPFGAPVGGDPAREAVDGVLVTPGATSDLDASRPDGARVALTVHFPRGYVKTLKGCEIEYSGETYRVIGDPHPYMDAGVPGPWTMPAEVERVDG